DGNRLHGISEWGGRTYDFVCPSRRSYPFQWLWDSCFHAIALLSVDSDLAKQEIRCLLQGAQPDGFLPHMLLWDKQMHSAAMRDYSIVLADTFFTATVQPPVLARAVWNWEDVMVNSIYADGLQCLGGLCREAGFPAAEAAEFERRGRRVLAALEDKCWDERSGVFWDLVGYEEGRAHTLTVTSL